MPWPTSDCEWRHFPDSSTTCHCMTNSGWVTMHMFARPSHHNSNREWVTALFFQLGSLISLHAHSLWATTLFSSVILFHLIKGSGWHLFLLSYFIKSHLITNSKWVYTFSAYCMALYITFHSHDNQIVSPFISPGSVITSHHMANSG